MSAARSPDSTAKATLFALATFAISFLARPTCALLRGPLCERLGRKCALALTILLMPGARLAAARLPSSETLGRWAPALLILLRTIQGFSTGGECGGAPLMLSFSLALGDAAMHEWGWRLPFLAAAPLGAICRHLRPRIGNTGCSRISPKRTRRRTRAACCRSVSSAASESGCFRAAASSSRLRSSIT